MNKTTTVKAWTVVFNSGYARGELTFWSADLHPVFTKKSYAVDWARELGKTTKLSKRPKVVSCTISYRFLGE
jgi:hypothetical protein